MTIRDRLNAFLDGWASAFDLFGTRVGHPDPSNGLERDYMAIASDWQAVGSDMWSAFNAIAAEASGAK